MSYPQLLVAPVPSVSHSTQVVTVVLLYTGIDDLFEVEMFLQNVNKWHRLGLALGLLYPTLERIDENQRGDIEKCRTKMIAAWLQQQDNVCKNGVPSWAVLRKTLKKIGENQLATSSELMMVS